jgi:hypothetical protein
MTELVNDRCNEGQETQTAEYGNSDNQTIPRNNSIKNPFLLSTLNIHRLRERGKREKRETLITHNTHTHTHTHTHTRTHI